MLKYNRYVVPIRNIETIKYSIKHYHLHNKLFNISTNEDKYNPIFYNNKIKRLIDERKFKEAISIPEEMEKIGVLPDDLHYNTLISGLAKYRALKYGGQVHEMLKKKGLLQKNIIFTNSLMNLYIKCDKLSEALHLFNEMLKQDQLGNKFTWNMLLDVFLKKKQGKEAFELYKRMKLFDVEIDGHSFVKILILCIKCNLQKEVTEMIAEFLNFEEVIYLEEYNKVIDVLAKGDFIEEAKVVNHFLLTATGIEYDEEFYVSIIKNCTKSNDRETGYTLYHELKLNGLLTKFKSFLGAFEIMFHKFNDKEKEIEIRQLDISPNKK
ncbi:hypothetical protein ABK040_011935 [Willaertia magna]